MIVMLTTLSYAVGPTSDFGWDAAMQGCDYVMRGLFWIANPKMDLICWHPLLKARFAYYVPLKKQVRVVLTSSIVSMMSGIRRGLFTPDDWTDVVSDLNTYIKSKTLAERAAWNFVNKKRVLTN